MAIGPDVRQLVSILEDEGFEALAGELLLEIGRGREVERPDPVDIEARVEDPASVILRVPIPEEEQFSEAMSLLRLRLVDPVRVLRQADEIASKIADAPGTRIRFIDPIEPFEVKPLRDPDVEDPEVGEDLSAILDALPQPIKGPESGA